MKTRVLSFVLVCCMLVSLASAGCGEVDYNSTYEYAIRLVRNDPANTANLKDAVTSLEKRGAVSLAVRLTSSPERSSFVIPAAALEMQEMPMTRSPA